MKAAIEKGGRNMHTILFKDKQHKDFYRVFLPRCRWQDERHKALVYCLGLSADTRARSKQIYDFESGAVRTECLHEAWQTGESERIIRMAFSLYCNGTPSVYDYEDGEGQLKECQNYTAEYLFCCGLAAFFWEAVKLRYPECAGRRVRGIELSCSAKVSGRHLDGQAGSHHA